MRKLQLACLLGIVGASLLWFQYSRTSGLGLLDGTPSTPPRMEEKGNNFFAYPKRKRPLRATPVKPPLPFQSGVGSLLIDSSVEDRIHFSESLQTQDLNTVFGLWLQGGQQRQDRFKFEVISMALSARLRREPESVTANALAEIEQVAVSPTQDASLRWSAMEVLGEAASPGALSVLLRLLRDKSVSEDFEPVILGQIAGMGDVRPDGRFREDLTPLLAEAWRNETNSARVSTFAIGLAKSGAPAGVDLLMQEIRVGGETVQLFEQKAGEHSWAAFEALPSIRNLESVPVLERYLRNEAPGGMMFLAAGEALAAVGQPEATRAILEWARAAEIDASSFVGTWILSIRDEGSLEMAKEFAVKGEFLNSQNQKALADTLAKWKALHSP